MGFTWGLFFKPIPGTCAMVAFYLGVNQLTDRFQERFPSKISGKFFSVGEIFWPEFMRDLPDVW